MDAEALHHLILTYDIQLSTKLDNATKHMMRQRLEDACAVAGAAARLPEGSTTFLDRGDGALLLMSADVPKKRVLDIWLRVFHRRLHDAYVRSAPRIQVRLAVHAGEVQSSGGGQVSPDIDFACRLVDAPEAKRILAATPSAPLAVVVSEAIYRQVVRPSAPELDPEAYTRIPVQVKETSDTAWLQLPGWARVPVPPQSRGEPASPASDAADADEPGSGNVFNGPVGVVGKAVGNRFTFGGGAE